MRVEPVPVVTFALECPSVPPVVVLPAYLSSPVLVMDRVVRMIPEFMLHPWRGNDREKERRTKRKNGKKKKKRYIRDYKILVDDAS